MRKHLNCGCFPSSSPSSYIGPIHQPLRYAEIIYLQCLQQKLCELKPSKYNITSHKKFSCNVVKCWKTFSYFSILTFLWLKIHFYVPRANTLARIREDLGGAILSELSHVLGNFHFDLLTSGDNLYLWDAGFDTIKTKTFSFHKTFLLSYWSVRLPRGGGDESVFQNLKMF